MSTPTIDLPATGVKVGDTGHINDTNKVANALQVLAQAGAFGAAAAPYMPYNVRSYGAVGDGVTDDKAAIMAAFDAAEENGGGKIIYFPTGKYRVVGTLNLSGYTSVIHGDGGVSDSTSGGTVILGASQSGPVISLDGWKNPQPGRGRVAFEGFTINGDGVGDVGKTHAGLYINAVTNTTFRDISIWNTGGPGLRIGTASYCDFERIMVATPITAKGNDVPFVRISAATNCRFRSLGLYSTTLAGPSGAMVIDDTGASISHHNLFEGCWAQGFTVETNNAIVLVKGYANTFTDWSFTGCAKSATSATGTAVFRFSPPSSSDIGGNAVRGLIPGSAATIDIDTGVDLLQARNLIEGIRGGAAAVTVRSGVGYTSVQLKGCVGTPAGAGIVDSSGQSTNSMIDFTIGSIRSLSSLLIPKTAADGGAGLQLLDPATPTLGALWLGNQGPRVQADNTGAKNLTVIGDAVAIKNAAGTKTPATFSGSTAAPALSLVSNDAAQPAARVTGSVDFATDGGGDLGSPAHRVGSVFAKSTLYGNRVILQQLPAVVSDFLTISDPTGTLQTGIDSGFNFYAPGFNSGFFPGLLIDGNNSSSNTNSAQSASFKEQNCNTLLITVTRACHLRVLYTLTGHSEGSNKANTIQATLHRQNGNVAPATDDANSVIDEAIGNLAGAAIDTTVGAEFLDLSVQPGSYTYNVTFMPRGGTGYKNGQFGPSRLYIYLAKLL